MNLNHESLNELNELLSALCDGPIRSDQLQRLEELVCGDLELRSYYTRYMLMQGTLSRFVRVRLDYRQPLSGAHVDGAEALAQTPLEREIHQLDSTSQNRGEVAPTRWSFGRMARYATAAALILLCLLIVDERSTNSVSAKAFAMALRQLNTARVISYTAEFKEDGKIVRASESMHLQPDRVREEMPDGKIKIIDFSKRRNITLDPVRRTAVVVIDSSHPPNYKQERFLDKVKENIERIRTDPLRTDSYLGTQTRHGRRLEGFELRKPTQLQTLWVDVDTGLLSEMEIVSLEHPGQSVVMQDFKFDVESYESLFSVEPPLGYEVRIETAGPTESLDDKAEMIPN